MPTRNKLIYEKWTDIQDIIGSAQYWPYKIRLFWNININHWERILLATFVYVNGLNPDVFREVFCDAHG